MKCTFKVSLSVSESAVITLPMWQVRFPTVTEEDSSDSAGEEGRAWVGACVRSSSDGLRAFGCCIAGRCMENMAYSQSKKQRVNEKFSLLVTVEWFRRAIWFHEGEIKW